MVAVGSVYAADNADSAVSDDHNDDFELDEDFDDDSDDDDWEDGDSDDDWEDDSDDDWEDDDSDDDWEDDDDDEDWDDDYNYTDYDYLEYKILCYLDRYGNCTDENWTESQDFLNEYQIYLSNPSNYTLNESAEGYQTYLKIFDSITSTFDDYNLTENETAYLKFMVIYYLNHYGNVSANYTWNESESFENFTPPWYLTDMCFEKGFASSSARLNSEFLGSYYFSSYSPLDLLYEATNQTSTDIQTAVEAAYCSRDVNIFILLLVIVLMIFVIV